MDSYYLSQILQVLNDIKTMCVVYLPFVKNPKKYFKVADSYTTSTKTPQCRNSTEA